MRGLAVISAALGVAFLAGLPLPNRAPKQRRSINAKVLRAAVSAAGAAVLTGWALTSVLAVALALGVLAASVPFLHARRSELALRTAMTRRWPDFIAALRSMLATGATIQTATIDAGKAAGGPFSPLAERLSIAVRSMPLSAALQAEQRRLADPIADRVLSTLRFAAESGGRQVGSVLAALSKSVAEEVQLRLAHEASMTEQRLTAAVALVAPWLLLVLTIVTNPTAGEAYRSSAGVAIILCGLGATVVGYRLALRTARLSKAKRVYQ